MHVTHTQAQQPNADKGKDHRALQEQCTAGKPSPEDVTGLDCIDPKGLQKKARLIEHDRGQKADGESFSKPQQSSQEQRDHNPHQQRQNKATAVSETGWVCSAHSERSLAAAH
jgi:hypothetical protein